MEIVLQDGIKDCGISCLLSIIRFYGGNVSKEYLRKITNTTKSGVTAYNLVEGSKKVGFQAVGMTGNLDNIENNNLPCIAHVIINRKFQHFIVIYKIDLEKNKITIMDPAKGKVVITKEHFNLLTSNNYIYLHPIKPLPIIKEKKIIKERIINTIKDYKGRIPFIIFLTTTYFIFNIITAFHFKFLLEYAIKDNIKTNIRIISISLLLIYLIKELTSLLKNIILLKWSNVLDENITVKTFVQIILLPYFYFRNRTTGEVITRIKDLSSIKLFIIKLISSLTTDILSIIIFIIFMFHLNKILTLIIMFTSLNIFIIDYLIRKVKKKYMIKAYKNEDKINNFLIEKLASAEVIKNMHTENYVSNLFKKKYQKYLSSSYIVNIIEIIEKYLKKNVVNIIYLIIFTIGTKDVINKSMSLGQLIIYETLINYYLISFQSIISLESNYSSYKLSLSRIEDLFNINKENFEGANFYLSYKLDGDITYNNLSYRTSSKKIFNELNLTISKGEKLLICGPSGSGKSTLMKMLLRYIEIPYGHIKINNIDINHYHLENIRSRITYVSQQEFLYTTTIYNNIVMNKEVEEEKLIEACKTTQANKIKERDILKFQQLVEENGYNYSGGERQKIILTRTILKDSDIYIFDEALNQIDIESEKKILNNIFKFLKGKTVIVISHRFNNKDLFDRVITIEKGKVVES